MQCLIVVVPLKSSLAHINYHGRSIMVQKELFKLDKNLTSSSLKMRDKKIKIPVKKMEIAQHRNYARPRQIKIIRNWAGIL